MSRQEIEEKVREFLIEDLEIDEDKIVPEGKLKDDLSIDRITKIGRASCRERV